MIGGFGQNLAPEYSCLCKVTHACQHLTAFTEQFELVRIGCFESVKYRESFGMTAFLIQAAGMMQLTFCRCGFNFQKAFDGCQSFVDLGLYLIGRYATQFLLSRRWVDAARLSWMEEVFAGHAVKTVLLSRFLPGARTVAYSAAGAVRYPFPRFLALLSAASLVQSLLFLWLGAFIGDRILPYLRQPRLRVALIAAVVLAGLVVHQTLARRRARALARKAEMEEGERKKEAGGGKCAR